MSELHTDRMRKDIGRAVCDDIQQVLNRRVAIASSFLDTPDIAVMFYEIAVSIGMGAMTFAVQHAKPDQDTTELAGDIARQVGVALNERIPAVLAAASVLRAGGGLAAATVAANAVEVQHG